MKKVLLASALVLLGALATTGCSESPGVETYKPAAGVKPDCDKYSLATNQIKCKAAESRH